VIADRTAWDHHSTSADVCRAANRDGSAQHGARRDVRERADHAIVLDDCVRIDDRTFTDARACVNYSACRDECAQLNAGRR
jgi:hypothetical protein